jgi:hypothetical protein
MTAHDIERLLATNVDPGAPGRNKSKYSKV